MRKSSANSTKSNEFAPSKGAPRGCEGARRAEKEAVYGDRSESSSSHQLSQPPLLGRAVRSVLHLHLSITAVGGKNKLRNAPAELLGTEFTAGNSEIMGVIPHETPEVNRSWTVALGVRAAIQPFTFPVTRCGLAMCRHRASSDPPRRSRGLLPTNVAIPAGKWRAAGRPGISPGISSTSDVQR